MESEKELNSKILEITMTIREKYPELYEHLGEMPVTIPNIENPEINNKNLRDYYDSLKSILKNYVHEHLPEGTK
jgi:hypothetical protein